MLVLVLVVPVLVSVLVVVPVVVVRGRPRDVIVDLVDLAAGHRGHLGERRLVGVRRHVLVPVDVDPEVVLLEGAPPHRLAVEFVPGNRIALRFSE